MHAYMFADKNKRMDCLDHPFIHFSQRYCFGSWLLPLYSSVDGIINLPLSLPPSLSLSLYIYIKFWLGSA